jgi:pimeloyl-ACP methyl ester carboxylesterase
LVFLHDALGCARLWRDLPERLARATGLRALVFDRLGAGDSPALSPPYSPAYLLDEALRVLPQVRTKAGLGDIVLVGHSDGASIALAHAGAFPDGVLAVVALAPHLFREDKTLAQIDKQIADYEHGDLKARLARYHGGKTGTLFARLVEVWTRPGQRDWGLDEHLRRIRCPVLAIQGMDDEFFSAAQIEALNAAVPGGIATVYLPDCGHALALQAPRPIAAAAAQFIAGALACDLRQAV